MADLIIKPATGDGNKLILQDKAGGAVLTTADSGATIADGIALGTPASGVMTNMTGAVSASIGNDQIDSQHYAAGSIDGEHIANDAVDSQHYAADSIDAEHYAPASVDTTAMAASVIGVKPHIIPDVLYPAVAGKLLDGSTSHGATYGVAQSDGRMYYYTDIKGSKPIKDPRIGAHFGSQRHMFKSIQLLEQETATHGLNVYSIDGREWARAYGEVRENTDKQHGQAIFLNGEVANHGYYEITGYFSDFNWLGTPTQYTNRGVVYAIDGASYTGEQSTWEGNPKFVPPRGFLSGGPLRATP